MKKILFIFVLCVVTPCAIKLYSQKTLEFEKIQFEESDKILKTVVTLDRCMDSVNEYCVATIEMEGSAKMTFNVNTTTLSPNGKLILEMTSLHSDLKIDFEVNPEETVALFLNKDRGVFVFFKKQEVNIHYQLRY